MRSTSRQLIAQVLPVAWILCSACAVSRHAAIDRVRLTPPSDHALAGRLATADVIVAGVLTKAQRDIDYETPCGIIAHILRRCDDTQAYAARIRAFDGHEWSLMFFRLGPGPHPAQGDSAVWVLHRDAVYPYLVCAQRAALTSTGCLSEPSFVLESDDDVLPLSEWPRVQRLLQALNL
jgi:ribosomal protein S26